MEAPQIAFHPMQNDATSAISNADMRKVIGLANREAEVVDFSKLTSDEVKANAEEQKQPAKGKS